MIPYDWNKFVNHVKNLITIISQTNVFGVMTISMWQINILTNYQFQMEDDKICEVGQFFIPNIFWLTNSNPNLVQFKNRNRFYYIAYTHYSLNLIF